MKIPSPKKSHGLTLAAILLGLFPAFFLPILQVVLVIALISLALWFRDLDRRCLSELFTPVNGLFAQTCIFFFLNAALFDVFEGNEGHFRGTSMESWSTTLLALFVVSFWLSVNRAEEVKMALIHWTPVGLSITFIIATALFVTEAQGDRIHLFGPNKLLPPLWFLVLTVASFSWFQELSRAHKIWRLILFLMAGLMAVYAGARLIMLAWILSSVLLALWVIFLSGGSNTRHRLFLAGMGIILCIAGFVLVDVAAGGYLTQHFAVFFEGDFSFEGLSERFLRLQIWAAAAAIISESLPWGIGQVNERLALNREMPWELWYRAHQTYLSYMIAGGIVGLISGVLTQLPVLVFLKHKNRTALFPAFVGLGVVVTMNCFTDSIFQSVVAVQIFMVLTLLYIKASKQEDF